MFSGSEQSQESAVEQKEAEPGHSLLKNTHEAVVESAHWSDWACDSSMRAENINNDNIFVAFLLKIENWVQKSLKPPLEATCYLFPLFFTGGKYHFL